jgi:UTP-glucose-1-phosphate uridylyltransferase
MTVAVILAAGKGTRLHPYSKHIPKPLTKVLGKPIIEHTIRALQSVGIKDIVVVTGYLGNLVESSPRSPTPSLLAFLTNIVVLGRILHAKKASERRAFCGDKLPNFAV